MIRTTDTAIAAFLMLRGHELVRLEDGPRPDQRVFVFRDEAAADVDRYERGGGAPAKAYALALRQAKRLLFRKD